MKVNEKKSAPVTIALTILVAARVMTNKITEKIIVPIIPKSTAKREQQLVLQTLVFWESAAAISVAAR